MTQVNQKLNRYQHYDSNTGGGYGLAQPKFHKHRSFVQYPEPPERDLEADAAIDDETYTAVLSRLLAYTPSDQYAKNKTDPFYFAGSATKLGEASTGMVPFPRMYKAKQAIAGGSSPRYPTGPTAGFQSRARPTGTKRGFSSAPYPEHEEFEDSLKFWSLSDILTTDLDEEHVDSIKKMVNLIHLEQQR